MGMALLSPATITTYQNFPTNPTKLPLFLLSFSIPCTRFYTLSHSTTNWTLSFPIRSHRSFHLPSSNSTVVRPRRCRAASPGPPPPPRTDPPAGQDSRQLKGLIASLSKFQDRLQIFFAVLFWMSLFFWASAWDGRNRPNKGSRFRR
ncbi:hypothetical protein L6164_004490 [Bauhinia variegata]|uniref:Uncharacterized protein n=1 Tax=Bauhinia variegata TaxID=167791 RepID=A0ACB9QA38_BAUVA|nr:hypothetical protein L6164_004490 [Bauhinia variegata]